MKALVFLISLLFLGLSACQVQDTSRQASVSRIGHEAKSLVLSWQPNQEIERTAIEAAFDAYFGKRLPIRFQSLIFASQTGGSQQFIIEATSIQPLIKDAPLLSQLRSDPQVKFVSHVYQYSGQGLESKSILSSLDESANRHLEVIEAERAWQISRGDPSVIVAVTDDGFDFDHQALRNQFWLNQGEIGTDRYGDAKKSNGIDDDLNGYIDDYRGWDFTKAGNNDPSPESGLFFALDAHGTHIAGILAGTHEGPTSQHIKGIAPHSPLMALRFSGSGTWNSINIARSYAYAVDQGARIINTSYAIDQYIDDPIYLAAVRYAYDSGLLIFNSAGNQGRANPDRQSVHEILLVANSHAGPEAQDRLNPNSNYGSGIDFVAPGDIYSSTPNNRFQVKTGTSMATPIVAGVAALIWSANPDWTRDQVAAQLAASSDPIDELNPGYEGKLGYGRVNAGRALSDNEVTPPRLQLKQNRIAIDDGRVVLRSLAILDAQSVNEAPFALLDHLGNPIRLELARDYRIGTNEIELIFPDDLSPGTYDLYVPACIRDPFGQALDGNHDGQAGQPMIVELEIARSHDFSPFIESISLSKNEVAAGERQVVELILRDEHSTISEAQLIFTKYDGSIELASSDGGSGPREKFTFNFDIPKDQDNGFYYLTRLELTNLVGSKSSFHIKPPENLNNPDREVLQIGFKVYGGQDNDRVGPELLAVEIPEIASMGQNISISVRAVDRLSGVQKIDIVLRSAETFQNMLVEKLVSGDGHQLDYELELEIPWLDRRQEFFIAAIFLTDRSGNISRYQASDRSETFTHTQIAVPRTYIVEDLNSDISPPRLLDAKLVSPEAFQAETARVLVHAVDDESKITSIRVFFRKDLVVLTSNPEFVRLSEDLYEVTVPIRADDDIGLYRLYKIELEDEMGNRIAYQSLNLLEETYPGTEIPVLYLDVQSRLPIDTEGPMITAIEIIQDWEQGMIYIDIEAHDRSGIEYIDVSLLGLENRNLAIWSESGLTQTGPHWYRLQIRMGSHFLVGKYFLNYLLAVDIHGNASMLQADPQDRFFKGTDFQVPLLFIN